MSEMEQQLEIRKLDLKMHLKKYFDFTGEHEHFANEIKFFTSSDFPEQYRRQYQDLKDTHLAETIIAVVPDAVWHKGTQPTESDAARSAILIKESYWKGEDTIAWLTHELAHCQEYRDSPQTYEHSMKQPAFADISSEYSYPNNLIERRAFQKQFVYLKIRGLKNADIISELQKYGYTQEDTAFFEKILKEVA